VCKNFRGRYLAVGIALHFVLARNAIVAQCTFSPPAAAARPVLLYRFGVNGERDSTTLGVILEFTGSASGIDTVSVPVQWAGERLQSMRRLRALDADVEIDSIADHALRIVKHPPGRRVRLAYELRRDWTGALNHPYEFHPMIFGGYIEMTGANALVRPRFDIYTPIAAEFDWTGVPASWAVATSFGTADHAASSSVKAPQADRCQTFNGPWRDVSGALFAAGDFRVHRFTIGTKPAVLAIRGPWAFTDSAVIAEIQRNVGLVRAFWHDDNFPYFLVTWAPFDRDHGSSDGTGFTNALWIFMSKLDSLSTQTTQLTHEAFHAWDPRRMGQEPDGEESRIGWFHEGFTTYYADEIAYRAGLIPLESVVRRANRDLTNFEGSTDSYTRGDVIAPMARRRDSRCVARYSFARRRHAGHGANGRRAANARSHPRDGRSVHRAARPSDASRIDGRHDGAAGSALRG